MLRKNLGCINPDKLNAEQNTVLRTFLLENPNLRLLKEFTPYSIELLDMKKGQQTKYEFELSRNMIARQRKDNRSGNRYEILDDAYNALGKGGFGTVLKSIGVLAPEKEPSQFFKPKQRAIKVQTDEVAAKQEYEQSRLVPHLHAKPLTQATATLTSNVPRMSFFMAEKLLPGTNLYKILDRESRHHPRLDTDQRITISIKILIAIQEQAHKLGLIHRDIKPENIMVNLATGNVYLVDYRFAKPITTPPDTYEIGGTIITAPPEQLADCPENLRKLTIASDSYATGKTLAEFWHANAEVNLAPVVTHKHQYQLFLTYAQKDTVFNYDEFFQGNLSARHATHIQNMLEQLTRANADDRWSITQAIDCLRTIQMERLPNTNNKTLRSGKP